MALLFAVAALLWLLLLVLAFAFAVVLFFPGNQLSGWERFISAAVMLLLATPLVLQIRTLGARKREYKTNIIVLDDDGIKINLSGNYRAAKGLPDVAETRIPWSEVTEIGRERRKFIYPSLIPFEYPLDVYTIVSRGAKIAFTPECVINARRVARQIAAHIGRPM